MFFEIDGDICANLRDTDSKYLKMHREIISLQTDFPVVPQIIDEDGAVSLSAEEHKALVRYLGLKHAMENIERREIYFRGHTDGFAYLKKNRRGLVGHRVFLQRR
ncbi:MAG: hypothetical protein LBV27_02995 [Oscillospiraceae bacterium]|nr:hypothetical protein [Oscillospiraceae bacterium]